MVLFVIAGVAAAAPADLVFVNGAVYTVDAARSWATAVAISGKRITYVGDDATARRHVGPATRVIDLGHRMLLPAFQDSHVHPAMVPDPATALDLHGLVTRDAVFQRIRAYALAHPGKAWIVGDGWDETAFLPSGRPDRGMLDALVPGRPALMYSNGGWAAWANSAALAAAHITRDAADPPNGRIGRDAQGEPNGALENLSAMALVEAVIPPPTSAEMTSGLSAALDEMTRQGLGAFVDAEATPGILAAYASLQRRGRLGQRTVLCQPFDPGQDDDAQFRRFVAQRRALAAHRLRAGCIKFFLDGAYGSHTVALLAPYSDDASYGSGKLFVDQTRLDRMVTRLDAAGFQVHVHAQGDAAVRSALDAFGAARRANGALDNRHTIAHACLVDPADIPRFRALGVVANLSPLWSLRDTWESVFAPRLFGPERSQRLLQMRTLLESGAPLVWGSDWPVTGVSPLAGIETAVTHRYPGGRDPAGNEDEPLNPAERVSLAQAIAAYTSTGAYLMHEEQSRGSISAGKLADLVVLDQDLFAVAPLQIHAVAVDMTILDGRIAYARWPEQDLHAHRSGRSPATKGGTTPALQ
jgi:predicted amidohydrolase YtcJ